LSKNLFYSILLLTIVWIILREEVTVFTIMTGIFASAASMFFCYKFLPMSKTPTIRLFRLIAYLLFLIAEIYKAGFFAIKIILTGARVDIVELKTELKSTFLRTLLVNSITIVPGSVSLDLTEDRITVLWLRQNKVGTDVTETTESPDELLKGSLERMLLKVEK